MGFGKFLRSLLYIFPHLFLQKISNLGYIYVYICSLGNDPDLGGKTCVMHALI